MVGVATICVNNDHGYIDDLGNKLIKLRIQVEDDKIPGNMECDRFLSVTVY
jgi:hypothetical protein